ncbi:hypothetical protein VIBHAR_05810 [Vibrio campbellii ATCC BAA-1116]|uniref:Uncharacterized protein n=1 Tax=Vibrio campbellii (strain ATCC BAA-1116) TaxID=2902295 RepID=A7N4Y7_VIBC1|nr:hypothetical protein VIBHAR_05810 [Vibrio campbellii ATCC BAA-1116]
MQAASSPSNKPLMISSRFFSVPAVLNTMQYSCCSLITDSYFIVTLPPIIL